MLRLKKRGIGTVMMGKQRGSSVKSNVLTSVFASLGGLIGQVIGFVLADLIGNMLTPASQCVSSNQYIAIPQDEQCIPPDFWEEIWSGSIAYAIAIIGLLTDMEKIDLSKGRIDNVKKTYTKTSKGGNTVKQESSLNSPIQEALQEVITGLFTGVYMKSATIRYNYFQAVPWTDDGDQVVEIKDQNGIWMWPPEIGKPTLIPLNIDTRTKYYSDISTNSETEESNRNFNLTLYVDQTPLDGHNTSVDVQINSTNFIYYDFNLDGLVNEEDEFGKPDMDGHRSDQTYDFYYVYSIPTDAYQRFGIPVPE